MNEQVKILEMVQAGTITPEEAAELLKALGDTDTTKASSAPANPTAFVSTSVGQFKYLKVKVDTESGETKVNVNIPLKLVRAMGGLLKNVDTFIPADAKSDMHSKGINLSQLDISSIIDLLESGELENNTLVDIDATDEKGDRIHVKIYVE